MHAVVVRVTLNDPDSARGLLESQVVPRVSGMPGFKAGYWTWDDGRNTGVSMVVFDSRERASAAADAVPSMVSDAVSLDGVEIREVVASA
jgi:hypothetical protein